MLASVSRDGPSLAGLAVFGDFSGCCALMCTQCKCYFCAHCFWYDKKNDDLSSFRVHEHMTAHKCKHNPNPGSYLCERPKYYANQNKRKRRLVEAYVEPLSEEDRIRVLHGLGPYVFFRFVQHARIPFAVATLPVQVDPLRPRDRASNQCCHDIDRAAISLTECSTRSRRRACHNRCGGFRFGCSRRNCR